MRLRQWNQQPVFRPLTLVLLTLVLLTLVLLTLVLLTLVLLTLVLLTLVPPTLVPAMLTPDRHLPAAAPVAAVRAGRCLPSRGHRLGRGGSDRASAPFRKAWAAAEPSPARCDPGR